MSPILRGLAGLCFVATMFGGAATLDPELSRDARIDQEIEGIAENYWRYADLNLQSLMAAIR